MPDTITISDLSIAILNGVGPSAFNLSPPPPCPVSLTLTTHLNPQVVPACVREDTMSGLGLNYSSLSKAIIAALTLPDRTFLNAAELLEETGKQTLALGPDNVESVRARLLLPKASLVADSVCYSATFTHDAPQGLGWICEMWGVRAMAVIGLHPHERKEKQRLECDIVVEGYGSGNGSRDGKVTEDGRVFKHKEFAGEVYQYLSSSEFGTLEALIENFAQHLFETSPNLKDEACRITMTLRKPAALPFAVPAISITRARADYVPSPSMGTEKHTESSGAQSGTGAHADAGKRVFVALGSNLGDRVGLLSRAIQMLEDEGVRVVDGGRWYESEPMYEEVQDRFINTVIEIRTHLQPVELMRLLKTVEKAIGRTKTYRNGPRVVDLDLLMYGTDAVKIGQNGDAEDEYGVGWLEVPHKSMQEREFVVRPFADVAPHLRHPLLGASIFTLLNRLDTSGASQLAPIIPLSSPCLPLRLGPLPLIMQIFNATPDSFSDGASSNLDIPAAMNTFEFFFSHPHPPTILDIGGMSTRPGSLPCTESEELQRVVPLVRAIRASTNPAIATVPISVDTFRPEVARAAIAAGGNIINDVRGGREAGMLDAMAELGVPVVLMHSRGDSIAMTQPEAQDYSPYPGGVVEGVKVELGHMIDAAVKAGVRRWNIILDPGLGFAKSPNDNVVLLRHLEQLAEIGGHRYPLLVGGSRKGFVGRITGRQVAKDRGYGDAAVTAWCCRSGVAIVRAHEGRGMAEVVSMWSAIAGEGEGEFK